MESSANLREAQQLFSTLITILLSPGEKSSFGTGKIFYAHFLMRMNVQWTDKIGGRPLPTAAVSITDRINLYINPTYFLSLTPKAALDLLEHEIEHVIYMHPLRARDYISTDKNAAGRMKCANIAMDANINEDKQESANKNNWITIAGLNKQLQEIGSRFRLDAKDPWEVHYEKLMQACKENPEKGDGEGFGDTQDDHDAWGESTQSKEVAEGIVRDTANKAQNATGIGNMPADMLREIANMNKASVNWKRELRQFFASALNYDFQKTRNRRNRRYGVIQPGRKKKPQLSIAICVDSSGSVSDASFSQFFAEIGEISDMGVDITIIEADAIVQAEYKFEKRKPVERKGAGGTYYTAPIERAKELNVDGIIFLGDGDSSDTPPNPKIPFLWALVGNSPAPGPFGKVIRVIETTK